MRKHLHFTTNFFLLTAVATLQLLYADAQEKTVVVTQEMINKVNNIVKPLREQADKLLQADATGTFKAYQRDVAALNKMKTVLRKARHQLR